MSTAKTAHKRLDRLEPRVTNLEKTEAAQEVRLDSIINRLIRVERIMLGTAAAVIALLAKIAFFGV